MRVLYFSKDYTPHDYRFLSRLMQTEHEVFYLRLQQSPVLYEERSIPEEISVIPWERKRSLKNVFDLLNARQELKEILQKLKPDLVHAGPIQMGAFLTSFAGYSPLISMSWGSDLLRDAQRGLGRWMAEYALKRSTVFICDCEAVANVAYELGMSEEHTVIFPWGVDLDHFSPNGRGEIRKSLGWEDEMIILSTRSMEKIYGVETIAKAFVDLFHRGDKVRMLFLGNGSLQGEIESIIHRAGLQEVVHFAGQVGYENLPEYYRAADLYVSASHVDGSSISLLEAMACGLPTLVSDIPGNLEWVRPGLNGWTFKVGSHPALATRMSEAIQDVDLLRSYGTQSRRIAEQDANWVLNSEKLLQAYDLAVEVKNEASSE